MDKSLTSPGAAALDLPMIRLVDEPRIWVNTPPWRWETRIPRYFNFWYVLDGRGELTVDGESHEVRPGLAFLLPPGSRIHAEQMESEPITNFAAHLVFHRGSGRSLPRRDACLRLEAPSPADFDSHLRQTAAISRWSDPLAAKEAEMMVFLALARLWRHHQQKKGPFGELIERLLDGIDAQPGKFSRIEQLCTMSGASEAHLRRLFMKRVGMSPLAYMIHRRMERAQTLLRSSPLHVAEIAHSLGYEDPLYFSRQFKRHCGISPVHWRLKTLPAG